MAPSCSSKVGCGACHGPRDAKLKERAAILPLPELSKKYYVASLVTFLPRSPQTASRRPHAGPQISPPPRRKTIAHYLLADLVVAGRRRQP